MFRLLRRHRTVVMVFLVATIGGLLFFGAGGSSFMPTPQDTIAKVNGEKVTQAQFDRLYRQQVRRAGELTAEQRQRLLQEVFSQIIRQEVFHQEAQKYGLRVTDAELQLRIASNPSFQKDGQFDANTYVRTVVQVFNLRPKDFEEIMHRDLITDKMNRLIDDSIYLPDEQMVLAVQNRLAVETDKEKKKKYLENPALLEEEIRREEVNRVFGDWINQLNSKLKISITSESFRKQLEGRS